MVSQQRTWRGVGMALSTPSRASTIVRSRLVPAGCRSRLAGFVALIFFSGNPRYVHAVNTAGKVFVRGLALGVS